MWLTPTLGDMKLIYTPERVGQAFQNVTCRILDKTT
jgi:hypothetical protein